MPFPPFFFDLPPFPPASAFPTSGGPVAVAVAVAAAVDMAAEPLSLTAVGASAISISPAGAAVPPLGATVVPGSDIFAPLANLPKPEIKRPISAALSVRYLRQMPVEGLYVFKVRVAIGVVVDPTLSDASAALRGFWERDFDSRRRDG